MKITETNSEQWEIKESGVATMVVGTIIAIGGGALLVWVVTHLATIAWWWSLVGVATLVIGVLVIFSASNRQITLRKQGATDIVTTRVIGGKQTQVSFNADQIVSVNLDTSDSVRTTTSGGEQETTRERTSLLYVLLRDNTEVMLATRRTGNNTSINGFNVSGLMKAPLVDEGKRIAAFYGVPLSSRMNNAGGIETIANVISAVKQGIAGAQQPVAVANMQPQAQSEPQTITPTPPLQAAIPVATPVQPVVPVVAPVQQSTPVPLPVQSPSTTSPQTLVSEPEGVDTQLPR